MIWRVETLSDGCAGGTAFEAGGRKQILSSSGNQGDCRLGFICAETDVFRKMARVLPRFGDIALEVGSATGACTQILARSCGDQNVVGVDISRLEVDEARRAHPGLRFECIDVLQEKEKLSEIAREASAVFVDIGGIRQATAVMRVLHAVRGVVQPRLLVVKNRALHCLASKVSRFGGASPDCFGDSAFERLEHLLVADASAYEYWQFWRSCSDADLGRYLRVFSDLSSREIEALEAQVESTHNPHEAKAVLADAATRLFHGAELLPGIHATAAAAFADNSRHLDVNVSDLLLPVVEVATGVKLMDLCVQLGFTKSKREAGRLIRAGGARLNGHVVEDSRHVIDESDFHDGKLHLSVGKRKHAKHAIGVPWRADV